MITKIFLAVLMNLSAAGSGLLLMAASAWLITSASFHPPLSTLAVGITIVRAAGLFRAVFRYAERYLTHTVIFAKLTQIRLCLYEIALTKFPLKSGATAEAELLHDLTVSSEERKNFFPRVVQPILSATIITIIVTVYLFETINLMALILPLSMILTAVISYTFIQKLKINDTDYREMLLDFYEGRDEIFIANSTEIVIKKLNKAAQNLRQNEQIRRNKIADTDRTCSFINAAAFVFILVELTTMVDIINLAVWIFILLLVFEMFTALPNAIRTFVNLKFKIENAELNPQNEILNKSSINNYSLRIENLTFGYNSKMKVIDNLNLEIAHGDRISIVGESGSGKTTFLYLLLNLWAPDFGKISINGTIAASTTNNYIFSTSIRENFLLMHSNITQEEIFKALKICQLENFDIDEYIGENGAKLSGGERCRLQTALALAANSEILILDEPTAGLDKKTAQNLIFEIINDSKKNNHTLIIVTHDFYIAQMMNKIYKLHGGSLERQN